MKEFTPLQMRALREVSAKLLKLSEDIKIAYVWKPEDLTNDHNLNVSKLSTEAERIKAWIDDILQ